MSILHKLEQTNFKNGFETHNAILDITPYKPEIMIIGTFNPWTPNTNFADFFYGRNFFWPAFKNLFVHNEVVLQNRRMPQRGAPPLVLDPSLVEIFSICKNLKLTFADLIKEVLHKNQPNYHLLPNDNIIFNNLEYNLIQDNSKGSVGGLEQLNALGQVEWTSKHIIKYLCENPQIKHVYFTRRPTRIWSLPWNEIKNHECSKGRSFRNIFTPSGQGKPVLQSMSRLLRHWLHNTDQNFGKLDPTWLENYGINRQAFS